MPALSIRLLELVKRSGQLSISQIEKLTGAPCSQV